MRITIDNKEVSGEELKQHIRSLKGNGTEQEGTFKLPCGHNIGFKSWYGWLCAECRAISQEVVKV